MEHENSSGSHRHEHQGHHQDVGPLTEEPHSGHNMASGPVAHDLSAADRVAHAEHAVANGRDAHGAHAGHDKHAGHSVEMFRSRFWLSVVLTLPVLFWSEMIQEWLGYTAPEFPGSDLIPALFGSVLFVYGGLVFLRGGLQELRDRAPGMMLLISLAITVAFLASAATTLGVFDLEFWWELALLIDVMLLGHWQEMKAIGQARDALGALAALIPDEAELVVGDEIRVVPASELTPGDLVRIRPGARVPADGTIVAGEAEVDESLLTGESRPVLKQSGDKVVAGSVVLGAALRITVDAVGEGTVLAGIQRLVEEAQRSQSRAQALADRFAAILVYVAVAAGLLTFVIWTLLGDVEAAVTRAVTVLVISCPHALGLAIPLVIALSTSIAARNGILVRDRLALERMRLVTAVLFDKTGTLTKGEPAVIGVAVLGESEDDLLALAAAVEADSEHPLARAILRSARERELKLPIAADFRATPGRGVLATVNGEPVAVGGPALLRERGMQPPAALVERTQPWSERGATNLNVIRGERVAGALALADEVRPESAEAIRGLRKEDVRSVMITGDAWPVARAVAAELRIDEVFAEILPEEKAGKVADLQRRGDTVAFVGDGVNDAPALATADVGIAIGAGTDVAIESAGVILASDDPRAVVGLIRLSQASYRKMVQNLAWAVGYNVVAIPLAAGVLAPIGVNLAPAVGAVLMSASTIVVALNAQLLRRVELRPSR